MPGILGPSTWKELGDCVAKSSVSMVYCPENKGIKCHACDCLVTKLGLLESDNVQEYLTLAASNLKPALKLCKGI